MDTFCKQCGTKCVPNGCNTGYGIDKDGCKICFACCGKNDLETMRKTGVGDSLPLYLTKKDSGHLSVGNWSGTLSFPVTFSRLSKTNMGLKRTDVWFLVDNHLWHGVHVGDYTDIVHCKRRKSKSTWVNIPPKHREFEK